MRLFSLLVFLLFLSPFLPAQSLTGQWEGFVSQDGKTDTFLYQVDMVQKGDAITGTSVVRTKDGKYTIRFNLAGVVEGGQLSLQEIRQTDPVSPKWCMKYAILEIVQLPFKDRLLGTWKADGCVPGTLLLERRKELPPGIEREIPPTITGKWTGTLSQSDREYGFYYEFDLKPGGRGQSYIVSEDNGGSAFISLEWSYDSIFQLLSFKEAKVISKTDARWKWCIKSATLAFRREAGRLKLEGDWSGFIEGLDPENGPCAAGAMYMEKPILTTTIVQSQEAVQRPYEEENKRKVKVARVLEVQNENIKIKVWDNGTVDGDVATIFLNGERILTEYRVSKRRIGIPFKLEEKDNFLVLHAESLGDISPNTVAISVDDGVREQIIILSSNLDESGAVLIKKFRVNN